jgi:glycine C-acetyltransferase
MSDLEVKLKEAQGARFRLIATDGSFSMDGIVADLKGICDLADRYEALVMVDDSHSTGFIGKTGRGTPEYHGVMDRVDIITSTFGKALGGASGGFTITTGRREIVDILRQRSRPYLFSNTLAPGVAAAVFKALETLSASTELRDRLARNTAYFREGMTKAGFKINPGDHPIVPIMLGDAKVAVEMADGMLAEGVYVIAFSYPVVPKDKARIRVQISAALTIAELDTAIAAFTKVGKKMGVI